MIGPHPPEPGRLGLVGRVHEVVRPLVVDERSVGDGDAGERRGEVALAAAHGDLVAIEVDVLDAQVAALEQAQAGGLITAEQLVDMKARLADKAYEASEAGRAEAWIVGPGGGTDDAARARLTEVLAMAVPILVDADAITLIAQDSQLRSSVTARRAPTLFTPHAGEFARLGGQLDHSGGRAEAVRRLATELRSVVLLKGAVTIVAAPDGPASVSASAPPDLATAGSGDVLAGLIGSMLAAQRYQGDPGATEVRRTAAAGAFLHGVAGCLAAVGGRPIVSEDVLAAIPSAVAAARGAGT